MEKLNVVLGVSNVSCALLVGALSLPLILEKVKMNPFYGFRFSRAFESDELWYRINKKGGTLLALWSLPVLAVGLSCFFVGTIQGPSRLFAAGTPILYLFAAIQTYAFSRKLQGAQSPSVQADIVADFLAQSTCSPASTEEISLAEEWLGITFPKSYRDFQLRYGDFCHDELFIHTVKTSGQCSDNICDIREHLTKHGDDPIYQAYNGSLPSLPQRYIPFCEDEVDRYYCFDRQNCSEAHGPIICWNLEDQSEDDALVVAEDFQDWLVAKIKELQRAKE